MIYAITIFKKKGNKLLTDTKYVSIEHEEDINKHLNGEKNECFGYVKLNEEDIISRLNELK